MDWAYIKEKIYYCDGSLRDIYILQTTIEDYRKWIDFVNENYNLVWFNGITQTNEKQIDFEIVKKYLNREIDLCSSASIFLDRIQINNNFFIDTEIENDISPKEINSIHDHNNVINYMINISKALNKPVILTPENELETKLVEVFKETVQLKV